VNEEGVTHYDDLIVTMVAAGIKPVVTLFHWGKPVSLITSR
jgi:beta-glucosidase/6-phospho-beta-glucosidase/beta-galactosidase